MLGNFLNKSKPINFIGLLVLFFICFLFTFFTEVVKGDFVIANAGYLFFYILLALIVFFFFNFIVTKNALTFDNSYAFYVFILLCIAELPTLFLEKNLILITLQILFLRKVYSLKSSNRILQKLFDAGFWLGVFFIFNPDALFFFLLLYFSLLIHQKITIQTLIAPIFGYLTPIVIYFSYLFWQNDMIGFSTFFSLEHETFDLFDLKNTSNIFIIITLTISLFSLVVKSLKIIPVSNTFRKSWFTLLFHFVLCLFLLLFFNNYLSSKFVYLFFPIALLLANGIELIKVTIVRDIVLFGLLISCFYYFFSI